MYEQREEIEREETAQRKLERGTPFTKIVCKREMELLTMANGEAIAVANIAPLVLSTKRIDKNNYEVDMERYEESLSDLFKQKRSKELHTCLDATDELLVQLHKIGIIHQIISEDNIVYNKLTGEVRLIDFGMSVLIAELPLLIDVEKYQNLY
jgi:tRNA A-37 threonylcarbamoyl transferase component Bud32